MYKRLLKSPLRFKSSFFLFGPRGTGKTSWLKVTFPNALFFDLLSMDTYLEFLQHPSSLEEKIPKGFEEWIVIDEIQKIPDLLNEVHRLIEKYKYPKLKKKLITMHFIKIYFKSFENFFLFF